MTMIALGNHTAVFAERSQQSRIREFYCEVLGCTPRVQGDDVDRFQLGDVHFCFVYGKPALDDEGFLRATWLELKAENSEETKRRILAFGVRKVDVPDPHLYFQAPGGQVFRLVGAEEDLSIYEGSSSTRPAEPGPSTGAPSV